MLPKKIISIVLPVYNEQNNIIIVYHTLIEHLQKLSQRYDYEIIFVNDGSTDDSWDIIQSLSKESPSVKGVNFSRNFGYQSALTAGYDFVSGDAVITMDSDLQHPPYMIEKMIAQWEQGSKLVYARRINRNDSFLKKFTAHCYYKILYTIAIQIPRNVNDFRLIDKQIVEEIKKMREKDRYFRGIITWIGFDYTFVDFEQPARISGTTKYTWSKLFKIAFDGILSFSSSPFKGALYSGITIIVSSLLLMIYQGLHFLIHLSYSFITLLTTILFLFIGVQISSMWVLGERVVTMYENSKNRPPYIISEKINC
jgi:polyisoprenyl-phosphate glycosyltransferase